MKRIIFFILAVVAFAACRKQSINYVVESINPVAVTFDSTIESRASGTAWSANDKIGIFMLDGSDNSDILSSNVAYKTSGNGTFAGVDESVYYPEDGAVDFLAYYPYQSTMSGYTYSIDLSDQSDLEAIDLMVAAKVEDKSDDSSTPTLTFTHKLCEVIFNLEAYGSVTSLAGVTATLGGVNVTNTFNVSTLNFGGVTTLSVIELNVTADGTQITAILTPQSVSGATLTFALDGRIYTGSYSETLVEGKSYSHTIPVGQVIFEVGSATTTDWDSVTPTDPTINTEIEQ